MQGSAEPPGGASRTGSDVTVLAGLLQKVAAAEPAAFNELYTSTRSTVFHTVVAVLRDANQAEEVTQEVFAEIWHSAARFDPARGSAMSWIRRLAHSRAVDRVRYAQSVHALDHRYHHRHVPRDVDSVVEQVLSNADSAEVHAALGGLTALQREALELIYLEEHSNQQASELLGIPVQTLKSRVLSGLASLRRGQTGCPENGLS